jgi:arginyl-tRNA synthetase
MNIISNIKEGVVKGVSKLYNHQVSDTEFVMSVTRKEFVGDYTVVVFTFTKAARKKPEMI